MNKIIIPALALLLALSFAGCKKPVEPIEPTEPVETTEPVTEVEETHWAYNAVYDGKIKILSINEESCMITAITDRKEPIFFFAVTTPFKTNKEYEATIFADGYIAVYGKEYIGTYQVYQEFKTDEALGEIESETAGNV